VIESVLGTVLVLVWCQHQNIIVPDIVTILSVLGTILVPAPKYLYMGNSVIESILGTVLVLVWC
jgi:hypothetical protein